MNFWRSSQNQPPLPLPKRTLPVLKAEQALRIAEVAAEGPETVVFQRMRASKGTDLTPATFIQPLREMAELQMKNISSLEIEAVREADLRGVQLSIRSQAAANTKQEQKGTFDLRWSISADDRSLGGNNRSGMLNAASDARFWATMEEHIGKALAQPPGLSLIIRARLDFEFWP